MASHVEDDPTPAVHHEEPPVTEKEQTVEVSIVAMEQMAAEGMELPDTDEIGFGPPAKRDSGLMGAVGDEELERIADRAMRMVESAARRATALPDTGEEPTHVLEPQNAQVAADDPETTTRTAGVLDAMSPWDELPDTGEELAEALSEPVRPEIQTAKVSAVAMAEAARRATLPLAGSSRGKPPPPARHKVPSAAGRPPVGPPAALPASRGPRMGPRVDRLPLPPSAFPKPMHSPEEELELVPELDLDLELVPELQGGAAGPDLAQASQPAAPPPLPSPGPQASPEPEHRPVCVTERDAQDTGSARRDDRAYREHVTEEERRAAPQIRDLPTEGKPSGAMAGPVLAAQTASWPESSSPPAAPSAVPAGASGPPQRRRLRTWAAVAAVVLALAGASVVVGPRLLGTTAGPDTSDSSAAVVARTGTGPARSRSRGGAAASPARIATSGSEVRSARDEKARVDPDRTRPKVAPPPPPAPSAGAPSPSAPSPSAGAAGLLAKVEALVRAGKDREAVALTYRVLGQARNRTRQQRLAILVQLGRLLRQGGPRCRRRAVDLLHRATTSKDPPVEAFMEYGRLFAQQEEVGRSVWCFRQAVKRSPDLAAAQLELGRALSRRRRWHDQARKALRRCLKLKPGHSLASEAQELLEKLGR